jgi:type II secretory pathway pseudopilin PulG
MIVVAIISMLAAIAIPNFIKARESSQRWVCVGRLQQIQKAKMDWLFTVGANLSATPTTNDLVKFLNTNALICPSGGTYTIGQVSNSPTCSFGATGEGNQFPHILKTTTFIDSPGQRALENSETCIKNLRRIARAQIMFGAFCGTNGSPPRLEDVYVWIEGDTPSCPSGGAYEVRGAGLLPRCSYSTNVHSRHTIERIVAEVPNPDK